MNKLTAKQARFVDEYLIDLNATAAAIRAGYSRASARQAAHKTLHDPLVAEAIRAAKAARAERLKIEQDDVLRPLWDAYTTDPNALVQFRRNCCRYCYGADFRYQRTAGEMERARAEHARRVAAFRADAKLPDPGPFDEMGGADFDKRRRPNADCPECFGDGVGEMFIPDTRDLTPEQRALYAGVEQTKDGLKLRTLDKVALGQMLGRHLGMFTDKIQLTRPKVSVKDMTGRHRGDDE